jgi:hypothetical protein
VKWLLSPALSAFTNLLGLIGRWRVGGPEKRPQGVVGRWSVQSQSHKGHRGQLDWPDWRLGTTTYRVTFMAPFSMQYILHGAFAPGRNEIPHLARAGECDMMHLLPGCILTTRRNCSETLRFRTGRGWLNRAGQGLDRPSRTSLGRVGARPRPRRRSREKTEKRDGKRRSVDPRQPAVAGLRVP